MANELVKIKNIKKSFGEQTILNGISLVAEKGENLIIFGQSGTGKSVLLKCLVGLLTPDSGEIYYDEKSLLNLKHKELNKIRKKIGFLFQGAALYDSMTVRENLIFPLKRNTTLSQREIDKKVKTTLEYVSLEDSIDKMPSELSGGMRKRIGLARSIITSPELMLYDEPTTGLDPITAKEISHLILELQKKLNMTSIVVTHDLICAKIIADRVIFLDKGKIIHQGSLDELQKSDDPFLQNFFSDDLISEGE